MSKSAIKILLVEPEPLRQSALSRRLVQAGYHVFSYPANRQVTPSVLGVEQPDIVICRLDEPVETDAAFLRWLYQFTAGEVGIIAISESWATDTCILALDSGADCYLYDPFEWVELLAQLRALVRRLSR